jgi:hypothetical protein
MDEANEKLLGCVIFGSQYDELQRFCHGNLDGLLKLMHSTG